MKKVVYFVLFIVFILLLNFHIKPYNIEYNINDYKIKESYKNDYYFEISDKEKNLYNFSIVNKRKFNKKHITNIEKVEAGKEECLIITNNITNKEYLCKNAEELITTNLLTEKKLIDLLDIKKEEIEEKEFNYYNNLPTNYSVAVWKYTGFYLLNENGIEDIDLFKKGRYSNDLSYKLNEYIFIPNYDEELFFTSFVILNMKNGKYEYYDTKNKISFDSNIVGSYKNNIFMYDKKSYNLYSINVKTGKIKVVGNKIDGYIKYENGKKVKASFNDYKYNKISFHDNNTNSYLNINNNYFNYKENKNINYKFEDNKDINLIYSNKLDIFYVKEDNLYLYNINKGKQNILHYYELNFNDKDRIIINNNNN